MGDRANFALRRPGSRAVDVRYAHWGSPFVLSDIFWGPGPTQAFIERLEKGAWLDDVWGEGAVGMCLRTKHLAFYTCTMRQPTAALALRLMQPLWPGWTLVACRRLTEVTPFVGVDLVKRWTRRAEKHPEAYRPLPSTEAVLANLENMGAYYAEHRYDDLFSFRGILSVVGASGACVDRLSDISVFEALYAGPPLLDALSRLPSFQEAERLLQGQRRASRTGTQDDLFFPFDLAFAQLDVPQRRITINVAPELAQWQQYAKMHALKASWPGWELVVFTGGIDGHYEASKRAVPDVLRYVPRNVSPSRQESLAHIESLLFDAQAEKAAAAVFLARARGEVKAITRATRVAIHPGLMQAIPKLPLKRSEKKRLYQFALARSGLTTAKGAAPIAAPPPDLDGRCAKVRGQLPADAPKLEELLREIRQVLAADPRHPLALRLASRMLGDLKRFDEAAQAAERGLADAPEDARLLGELSLYVGKLGRREEALALAERAAALEPRPFIVNLICFNALKLGEEEGDRDRRRVWAERALSASSLFLRNHPDRYWNEACALCLMQEDADRAYAAIREALRVGSADLGEQLLADAQLAWLWEQKGRTLPS